MIYKNVNNISMPSLGFGTYPLLDKECIEAVLHAIQVGYRHIDTAQFYENESAVGQALRDSQVDRREFFVTTKVWLTQLSYANTLTSFYKSLEKLKLDYVDLILIHWPTKDMVLEDCLRALSELRKKGLAKNVGVSNFNISLLKQVLAFDKELLFCHQFEYHPYLDQQAMRDFCCERNILMTAYSPLAHGKVANEPLLQSIGKKYHKNASQVALRWLLQQPLMSAIPKASKKDHIQSNFDIFNFELTDLDMKQVDSLLGDGRTINPEWGPQWD